MTGPLALLALLLLAAPVDGAAQATADTPRTAPSTAQPAAPSSTPAVSVSRIQKKLAERPATETDKLKLQYYIEVYGKAPPVDFLENFNVKAGPVPRSAPTHQELFDVVTPEGFRTPAPNLSALIDWLRRKAVQ